MKMHEEDVVVAVTMKGNSHKANISDFSIPVSTMKGATNVWHLYWI